MLPCGGFPCYASAMTRILLTAFEPYDPWTTNASWLALIEMTRELPTVAEVTTRLYPVDLDAMKEKLATDLKSKYDVAFHVGQAPGSSCIKLEELAINVATDGHSAEQIDAAAKVCDSAPEAYRSQLPVRTYAKELRGMGIPTRVSYHAGTYLCNAILFWSRQLTEDLQLPTKSTFVHIPLDTSQVLDLDEPTPFMPSSMVATALRGLVQMASLEIPEQTT